MVFGKIFRAMARAKGLSCWFGTDKEEEEATKGQIQQIPNIMYYLVDSAIKVTKKLSQGNFSDVYIGINDGGQQVVMKILREQSHADLLREVSILVALNSPYVVGVLGFTLDDEKPTILMEYCANGDLLNMLCRMRNDAIPWSKAWAKDVVGQIARGMTFVSEKRIVHRDLAARNCLVTQEGCVKIGDFGLARALGKNPTLIDFGVVAVAWMPPEVVRGGEFSLSSDVWSFGITIFEICTYGKPPFGYLPRRDVVNTVALGNHPPKTSTDLFLDNIMISCWNTVPSDRPKFMDLATLLLPE